MDSRLSDTAVVIRVPLPDGLERVRRRYDRSASGAPAHVTLLYPFVARPLLDGDVRARVASVAASIEPFVARFAQVRQWPGVVYLAPEPEAPFRAMIGALIEQFPDHPPYGGAHAEVIPHLTVAEAEQGPLDEIGAAAVRWLPFERPVVAVEVLVDGPDRHWRRHWRVPLGVRP